MSKPNSAAAILASGKAKLALIREAARQIRARIAAEAKAKAKR
jgi:hypothetical protein